MCCGELRQQPAQRRGSRARAARAGSSARPRPGGRARRTRSRAESAADRAAIGWPTVIATALSSVSGARRIADRQQPRRHVGGQRLRFDERGDAVAVSGHARGGRALVRRDAHRAPAPRPARPPSPPTAGDGSRWSRRAAARARPRRGRGGRRPRPASGARAGRRRTSPAAPAAAPAGRPGRPRASCCPRRAISNARASPIGPTSCATSAAPWTAGDAAIARNGCSAGSGANRSVVGLGSSDRRRPTSRRSQKPFGGRVIALANSGSSSRAASREPLDHAADRAARGAECPPELAFLRGRDRASTSSRCPGSARRNDISRRGRLALDQRGDVQLLEHARGRGLVQRRQQRRRRRQRHAAGVERGGRRLVARAP